jgi:hypothetical protein
MRTAWQANRFLNGQVKNGPRFRKGLCKRKCREAYLIESDGTQTATEAAYKTRHRFEHQWIAGAFAWWDGGNGHVAILCYQKGYVWTTDDPRTGHWNRERIEDVQKWLGSGHRFLFFSRDIDGRTPIRLPRVIRRYRYPA